MNFLYDRAKDEKKPDSRTLVYARVLGAFLFVTSINKLVFDDYSQGIIFTILDTVVFLLGFALFFFPRQTSKKYWQTGKALVEINEETVNWKFDNKAFSISLNEVIAYKEFVGEIHFQTKSQGTLVLPSHMIENRDKFLELYDVLKSKFTTY